MHFQRCLRPHISVLSITRRRCSVSISVSWSQPAVIGAPAVAVPRRLSSFSSLVLVNSRSNCAFVRFWSSNRTCHDSKEDAPFTERKPVSSMKTQEVTEKKTEKSVDKFQLQTWQQRAKTFAFEYGRVGICTHIVLSLVSFSTIYVGVSCGVDVTAILDLIGVSTSASTNSAGSILIAYTLYKVLVPIRWALTFAVTPVVLRALRRRGYMLAKTNSPAKSPPSPQ